MVTASIVTKTPTLPSSDSMRPSRFISYDEHVGRRHNLASFKGMWRMVSCAQRPPASLLWVLLRGHDAPFSFSFSFLPMPSSRKPNSIPCRTRQLHYCQPLGFCSSPPVFWFLADFSVARALENIGVPRPIAIPKILMLKRHPGNHLSQPDPSPFRNPSPKKNADPKASHRHYPAQTYSKPTEPALCRSCSAPAEPPSLPFPKRAGAMPL